MKEFTEKLEKTVEQIHYKDSEAIPTIVNTVFETILKIERSEFLDQYNQEASKQDIQKNKANGFYPKLIKSIKGFFRLKIPRDRLGFFKPVVLESIQEQQEQLYDMALKLYSKGLSTRSIQSIFKSIYKHNISHQQISNMVGKFSQEIQTETAERV